MSDVAVRAHGLGKAYKIARNRGRGGYKTLQEDVVGLIKRPFARSAAAEPAQEQFWALRDIDFEIKHGEVVGIIGRNGAGKSTLLKLLSRITKPTTGYADVFGRVGSLLEVGTGFHPELTGRENIYLNGAILGMSRADIRKRFDEIVQFAEVEQFLDTPVKRYSSGMYMRLAFAVAAHLEPEILIVDEVLAVGDAEFQKKSLGKMGDVAKSGRTVLFVSHNMNAVEELCTRAILLRRGNILSASYNVRELTTFYLQGDHDYASEWQNSGSEYLNPYFTPLRLNTVDAFGQKISMPFRNDQDVYVQIEGTIDVVDTALTIGYAVFSEQGETLFWSYQTDSPQEGWPSLNEGKCVLRSKFPSYMLNEGKYRLEIIGGLHFRQWLFNPGTNNPSIDIEIQGGLSNSPYWMTKRPGLLAPVLTWEVA